MPEHECSFRSTPPARETYEQHGIELADADRIHVFELSRYLAAVDRDAVLATRLR